MESDVICISSEDECVDVQPRKIIKKNKLGWIELKKSNKLLTTNSVNQVNKVKHVDNVSDETSIFKLKKNSTSNGCKESENPNTNSTKLNVSPISPISESSIFKTGEVTILKRKDQSKDNETECPRKRIKLSSCTTPISVKSFVSDDKPSKINQDSPSLEVNRASPTPGCSWFPDVEKPKLIIKGRKILYDDEFDLFSTFIETCLKRDSSNDMKEIVKKLKKRHERLNPSFLNSDRFKQLLIDKQKLIDVNDEKLFSHIAEINDEMKSAAKQSRSIEEKIMKTEFKKEVETKEKLEIKDESLKLEERRKRKKLQFILNRIEACKKRIKQLEEEEVDLNDDCGSTYLIEDRYKRKLVQLWTVYCKYSGEKVDAGRAYLRPKYIQATNIREVDQAIMNFINSKISRRNELIKKGKSIADTVIFPDYLDILNCISKCNEQKNLGFNKVQQEMRAKEAFIMIGKYLQRVRQDDYWDTFSLFLEEEDNDPALNDNDLYEKLKKNKVEGKKKMNNVFEEFSKKQETAPVEQNNDENGRDNEDDEKDDEDDDDDDEEEEEEEEEGREQCEIEDETEKTKIVEKDESSYEKLAKDVRKENHIRVENNVRKEADIKIDTNVRKETDARIDTNVRRETDARIDNNVRKETNDRVENNVRKETNDRVENNARKETNDRVENNVRKETNARKETDIRIEKDNRKEKDIRTEKDIVIERVDNRKEKNVRSERENFQKERDNGNEKDFRKEKDESKKKDIRKEVTKNDEKERKDTKKDNQTEKYEYNKVESEKDNNIVKNPLEKKKTDNKGQLPVRVTVPPSTVNTKQVKDSFNSTNQSTGESDSLPINSSIEVQDSSLGDTDIIDIDYEAGNADKQPLLRLRSFAKPPTSWKDSQGEVSPQFKKVVALTAKSSPLHPPVIRKFVTSTPKASVVKPAVVDLTSEKKDSSVIKSPRKPLDPATLSAIKNKYKTVMIPSNFKGKQIISVKNITNNYNVVNGSGSGEIIPARVLTSVSHKMADGSQTIIRIPAQNAAHLKPRNPMPVKILPKPGSSKQIFYQAATNAKMINPMGKIVKVKTLPNSDSKVMKVLNLNESQKVSITTLQKRSAQKVTLNANPIQANDPLQMRQLANNPRIDHQYSKKVISNVLRILKPGEHLHQSKDPNKVIKKI